MRKNNIIIILFSFFILFISILLVVEYNKNEKQRLIKDNYNDLMDKLQEELINEEEDNNLIKEQQIAEYINCLTSTYNEDEINDEIKAKKKEIDNFISDNKYSISVKYEDLNTSFIYEYKANKVYYGCSLIKILDAIYLINQAIDGKIDLDAEKMVYESKYIKHSSKEMKKKNIGDKVSLRDLIRYAITVSDNTAHLMLIDYIGHSTLRDYGHSLGAKSLLSTRDKFGNQTASDTTFYLEEAYKIITENEEYGPFLKEIMGNNERNSFNTDDIKIYHKYGYCVNYSHDIGLSLDDENPYAISILTQNHQSNYKNIMQKVHAKIIELHNLYNTTKENNCYNKIYGKEKE